VRELLALETHCMYLVQFLKLMRLPLRGGCARLVVPVALINNCSLRRPSDCPLSTKTLQLTGERPYSTFHSQPSSHQVPARAPIYIHPNAHSGPTPSKHIKHRLASEKEFPEGWSLALKLSRDAMDVLRTLYSHSPETFTTSVLAERLEISQEDVSIMLWSRRVPDKDRKAELRAKRR